MWVCVCVCGVGVKDWGLWSCRDVGGAAREGSAGSGQSLLDVSSPWVHLEPGVCKYPENMWPTYLCQLLVGEFSQQRLSWGRECRCPFSRAEWSSDFEYHAGSSTGDSRSQIPGTVEPLLFPSQSGIVFWASALVFGTRQWDLFLRMTLYTELIPSYQNQGAFWGKGKLWDFLDYAEMG